MRRTTLSVLSSLAILLSGMIVPEAAAQSRRDKEQTYVLEKPYEVKKLVPPTGKKIKNVILMIGDGMSLMHMYSAWTANRGKLWLDNSQYTGLSKTYCANRLITDSGAGGTALATGHKTNYHMVGVDPAGKPLESLATLANKKGLSSGIAVTCRLWDATPADFCCHNTDRDAEAEIVIRGVVYRIVDIAMRMLAPRELYRAQGFPDTYVIAPECGGKPISKTAQVRMCGNSVPPQFVAALVTANGPGTWAEEAKPHLPLLAYLPPRRAGMEARV